jgi:Uma2 family endonuclease
MATDARTTPAAIRRKRDNGNRTPYRFTVEQTLEMARAGIIPEDGSTELWDGVIYHVTKGETHNVIVYKLAQMLGPMIAAGSHLREEKSARRDEHSLPEPDLGICRGTIDDYWPEVPPLSAFALVVEVDNSTYDSDHVVKLAGYAATGVPVYWIVDVDALCVEVWSEPVPSDEGTTVYGNRTTFRPGEAIPVFVAGQRRGEIPVSDVFPRGLIADRS